MNNKYEKHIRSYLTSDERYSIEKLVGRKPNDFEMNMFAAMWSEHISYKSSVKWIDEFPVQGEHIRVPAQAENAGIFDLNDQYSCVIKMESHNHPTAEHPGEASVAVGNIFRDIVAMGGKPVALLNILRFGKPEGKQSRNFINNVIRALGNYSNNFGIPVIGGEVLFDDTYKDNPLVNLMAIGLVRKEKIVTASLKEKGDALYLIGKETSGTGVHGAGFASTAFSEDASHFIPSSQMADPVAGKILSECILDLNDAGIVKGMQDVGAGGVLCGASEMAFRGNLGIDLELDEIPVMDEEISPIDILLSQSQDQMLVAINEDDVEVLHRIAVKWKIEYTKIGTATSTGRIKVNFKEKTLGDLPVTTLVKGGGAPVYIRNLSKSTRKVIRVAADDVPYPGNLREVAKQLIQHPNIASRRYIYEQFDTMAGLSNTASFFPADAGIINLPGYDLKIAVSIDGNSRYVKTEPRKGSMIAVIEAARNIVCSGGSPVALTNCLNFGDPSDLSVYYDFVEAVKGIKQVSEKSKIPVIAGNVSFNNVVLKDGEPVSVQPTPIIGMVGTIKNNNELTSVGFKAKGDMIYILGKSDNDISGSEYLASVHLVEETSSPELDLELEMKLHSVIGELIERQLIVSAHDISLGGLFVALVECCLPGNLGFDITSPAEVRTDAFLFGESQSRVVVSVSAHDETDFLDFMIEKKFPFSALGHVTKQELRIDDKSFGFITDYARIYEDALGELLDKKDIE